MDRIDGILGRLGKNRVYACIAGVLFPLILCIFAMCKVNKGLDVTDTAFNLYNYGHVKDLDNMWFFAYLFTNLLGAFFTGLPFGNTMLGLNVYTGLVKCALILTAYFFFVRTVKIKKEYVFLALLAATGLCWCPTAVMYNYLTYLLFFIGTVFLYVGLTKEKNLFLILAGLALGLNVFVRFPNICEVMLILGAWFYLAIKKTAFSGILKKTLLCMAGFAGGLLAGVLVILLSGRGISGYFEGISMLFSMTKEATSYSASGMLTDIFKTYLSAWPYVEMLILGLLLVLLSSLVLPHKLGWLRYIFATIISLGLLWLLKRKGMFDFNYSTYAPVYYLGILVTIVAVVFFVFNMFVSKTPAEERLLCALGVLTIIVTPLGTNNALYANINNGFFVFPLLLYLLFSAGRINRYFHTIYYGLFVLFLALTFQSVFFGARFVFRDGVNEEFTTRFTEGTVTKNMITTEKNADNLAGLLHLFDERGEGEEVLLYGNVSGLGFYLDRKVAIPSAWPSLPSFSSERFKAAVSELSLKTSEGGMPYPAVIISEEEKSAILDGTGDLTTKQTILKEFLVNSQYELVYDNGRFCVLFANRNGE